MSDLISRCELFNRLATIPAPPEANDLKAEIYKVIQEMEAPKVAYICDRKKCEVCHRYCDLTKDIKHAITTDAIIVIDGVWEEIHAAQNETMEG